MVSILVAALALPPLFFLLWDSFKTVTIGNLFDPKLTNFTLANFRQAYADPATLLTLGNSFMFAAGSMVVAFVFGGSIAFLVERTNAPWRNLMYGLMFMPLIMPGMLKAMAWILLISPKIGLLNQPWFALGFSQPLFNAYSIPGMFWVEGLSQSSMTFLLLGAALRAMDPSLEEAAFTAGAGKLSTLFRVTLRLMTPAMSGIALMQFVRALDAFEVPFLMGAFQGIMVFSTNIYFALREYSPPHYGDAFVYALVLIVLSFIGLLLYQRAMGKAGQFATITGKGYRPRLIDLGRWRWLATGFMMLFFFVAVILPFLVLLYASFLPFYQAPSREAFASFSLENYQYLFERSDMLMTLKNTAVVCLVVSAGGMLLATLVSWVVVRLRPRGSRVLDSLVFIPYAIPSIAIALSYMIVFLQFPNPIYGTVWILVLAYLASFLPIATRFTHAGVAQVKAELEEAAITGGAGFMVVLRRITMPLILPSLVAGGFYLFLLSARVLSAAAILYTPNSQVLSILLFQIWREGATPVVGALSVMMVVALTTLTIVSRWLSQRQAVAMQV
ncbi:MAG: binding-protein-dependent transport system inner rane component [Dehalococcoidia bacterium]|nr:binding-protein-dependent transport system inner rane component [Dehalococcoidia bacterium]